MNPGRYWTGIPTTGWLVVVVVVVRRTTEESRTPTAQDEKALFEEINTASKSIFGTDFDRHLQTKPRNLPQSVIRLLTVNPGERPFCFRGRGFRRYPLEWPMSRSKNAGPGSDKGWLAEKPIRFGGEGCWTPRNWISLGFSSTLTALSRRSSICSTISSDCCFVHRTSTSESSKTNRTPSG